MIDYAHESVEVFRRDIVDLSVLPTCGKPRGPNSPEQVWLVHHVGIFSIIHRVALGKSSERSKCEGAGIEDHHQSQIAVAIDVQQAGCSRRYKASVGFGKPPHEASDRRSDVAPLGRGVSRAVATHVMGGYCSLRSPLEHGYHKHNSNTTRRRTA